MKNTSQNQKIGWLVMPILWAKVTGLTSLVALFCFCLSVGSAAAAKRDTSVNISSLFHQKNDSPRINYQTEYPFLINGNGGNGESMLFHSVLSGYQPGLKAWRIAEHDINSPRDSINGFRVTVTNNGLLGLYESAFYTKGQLVRYNSNSTLLEVNDLEPFTFPTDRSKVEDWLRKYGFSYEAVVPYWAGVDALYQRFQNDLRLMFPQYSASVEKRIRDCLVLIRTSDEDKISSQSTQSYVRSDFDHFHISNHYLNRLIQRLAGFYMQHSEYPVVDGTGFSGTVDLEINARLDKVEEVNRELEKYDLKFVVQPREMDILIIRDAHVEVPNPFSTNKFAESKPTSELKLRDEIPKVRFSNALDETQSEISLEDYKGKLIILDFWATWCTPCIAFMPTLQELQEKYKDHLQVISVTYQSAEEAFAQLNKMSSGTPSNVVMVTNDQHMRYLFPHTSLPHFVWIGPQGTFLAQTGMDQVNDQKIEEVLTEFNLLNK